MTSLSLRRAWSTTRGTWNWTWVSPRNSSSRNNPAQGKIGDSHHQLATGETIGTVTLLFGHTMTRLKLFMKTIRWAYLQLKNDKSIMIRYHVSLQKLLEKDYRFKRVRALFHQSGDEIRDSLHTNDYPSCLELAWRHISSRLVSALVENGP